MLINISWSFITMENLFGDFLCISELCTLKITVPQIDNFTQIIFKHGSDIHCPKILDELDYGDSVSLNMCIIDHLMSWSILSFQDSFFKSKVIKFGTNVWINMLVNISFTFYRNRNIFFCKSFTQFPALYSENYR